MSRVVMLTSNFHPHLGGAEKQALELSKALMAQGVEVLVLSRRTPGLARTETVSGVRVRRLSTFGTGLADSAFFLASAFLFLVFHGSEYDAIHAHLAGSPALAAALAGRLLGKTCVVKVGGGRGIGEIASSSRTAAGRLKLLLLRLLRPRFACVARDLLDELREHGLGEGAEVLANGVDLEVYRPAGPAEKAALRAGLGLPGGLLFVFVGRLSREKRLEPFLKAFEAALRGGTAASLAIAGAGPEEAALRRAAEGLRGRVVFLPPTPDIAPVFRAADVFVLPSESEGLSNSLLEAMASGLAVLASRVGGTREAVEEERTGVLFEPGDAAELRMQLSRLMRDGRLVERLGRAAREAAAGYSIEAAADRYRRIYFSAGKD